MIVGTFGGWGSLTHGNVSLLVVICHSSFFLLLSSGSTSLSFFRFRDLYARTAQSASKPQVCFRTRNTLIHTRNASYSLPTHPPPPFPFFHLLHFLRFVIYARWRPHSARYVLRSRNTRNRIRCIHTTTFPLRPYNLFLFRALRRTRKATSRASTHTHTLPALHSLRTTCVSLPYVMRKSSKIRIATRVRPRVRARNCSHHHTCHRFLVLFFTQKSTTLLPNLRGWYRLLALVRFRVKRANRANLRKMQRDAKNLIPSPISISSPLSLYSLSKH